MPADPNPPRPPVPQPSPAEQDRSRKNRAAALAALGVAAAVLVAAAGWAAGRLTAGQPLLPDPGPTGADSPTGADTAEPPAEPSAEPSATDTEPPGQRIRFRNLTLTFPADWTVTLFEDVEFFNGSEPDQGSVTDDWILAHPPGQPECTARNRRPSWDTDTEIRCAHVKIFGPGGIRYGGEAWLPITEAPGEGAYIPRTGLGTCPPAAATVAVPPDHRSPAVTELAPVGDRRALHREYRIACAAPDTGETAAYEQRTWLLPESQILVVDEYGLDGLDAVLAGGEFDPGSPGD